MNKKFLRCLSNPFEVHYGPENPVNWRMMEFYSQNQNPERFSEVKLAHEDIG